MTTNVLSFLWQLIFRLYAHIFAISSTTWFELWSVISGSVNSSSIVSFGTAFCTIYSFSSTSPCLKICVISRTLAMLGLHTFRLMMCGPSKCIRENVTFRILPVIDFKDFRCRFGDFGGGVTCVLGVLEGWNFLCVVTPSWEQTLNVLLLSY